MMSLQAMGLTTAPAATRQTQIEEVARCYRQPAHFLSRYGQIYDPPSEGWLRFDLWPAQRRTLATIHAQRLVIVLKARQLGMTWLALGYALWAMLFRPEQTVLVFSQRDTDAMYLLSRERMRGMFDRLPEFLRYRLATRADAAHEWALSNGSVARAFPTTAGRSYSATLAIVDEADFVEDLDDMLAAVKPTIDAGGKLVLISTADKARPESTFKRIFRGAEAGQNEYVSVFLPWDARPDRSPAWYEAQKADILDRTTALDDLWQEYPTSTFEALAPRALDRRFPPEWVRKCIDVRLPLPVGPTLPGLSVFEAPVRGGSYLIGVDPAEGNPQSDESAASVVEVATGAQVAILAGRFEPAALAAYIDQVSRYYNQAPALVERNNHGHAVLLWLREFSKVKLRLGLDGKQGWVTSGASKPMAMAWAADAMRDGQTRVRDQTTLDQLASISGSTLAAPEGQHDDRAMAHVLALAGLAQPEVAPVAVSAGRTVSTNQLGLS